MMPEMNLEDLIKGNELINRMEKYAKEDFEEILCGMHTSKHIYIHKYI